MSLGKKLINPTVALTTFTTWVLIFVFILGFMGAFSKKFMHFGPSTDPETAAEFLGAHIDTWPKVIALYILGFISSIMHSYYSTVFGAWMMNTVKDDKTKTVNMNRKIAYTLISIDPIISNINSILELFLTLTLQLQFLIPQILGDILASIIVSRSFLSKKKSFKN
jgi:hypothetical protein